MNPLVALVSAQAHRRAGFGESGSADFDFNTTVNAGLGKETSLTPAQVAAIREAAAKWANAAQSNNAKEKNAMMRATLNTTFTALAAAAPIFAPFAVWALKWINTTPDAVGGPGRCAEAPPTGPEDPAWHTYDADRPGGAYAQPPQGSFDEFVYDAVKYTYELVNNCRVNPPDVQAAYRAGIAGAILAWDYSRESTPGRTIERTLPGGWDPQDPLTFGLHQAGLLPKEGTHFAFSIYDGKLLSPTQKVQRASRAGGSLIDWVLAQQEQAPSTATKVATGAAVVGGTALLGGAVYAYLQGRTIDSVFRGAWHGIKKVFGGRS